MQILLLQESIGWASFVDKLHKYSEFCEFGDQLEDMLRDCVVVGINEDTIQNRLLTVEFGKLTLQ